MTHDQLSALLIELLARPQETEWLEWKHNNSDPEMIAERLSALANSAALHGLETSYFVWGVEDGTKKTVGTTFRPRQAKKGNEELENWLIRSLHPQINWLQPLFRVRLRSLG
jgi:ATP-dependent DNA helicase RecG